MRTWLFLLLSAGLVLARVDATLGQTEPRAVVEKALKAHGGDDKTLQLKAVQSKGKGTFFTPNGEIAFTDDNLAQHPAQLKNVKQLDQGGMAVTQTLVLNGDKGWVVVGDHERDLDEQLVANLKDNLYQEWIGRIVPLRADKELTLTAQGETKVDGKDAVGIKVTCKGRRDVTLFFDKASGMLVKTESRTYDPMSQQEVNQERFFSGYKDVAGIKRPTKVRVHRDGQKFMELEITEIQLREKLDASHFAKP